MDGHNIIGGMASTTDAMRSLGLVAPSSSCCRLGRRRRLLLPPSEHRKQWGGQLVGLGIGESALMTRGTSGNFTATWVAGRWPPGPTPSQMLVAMPGVGRGGLGFEGRLRPTLLADGRPVLEQPQHRRRLGVVGHCVAPDAVAFTCDELAERRMCAALRGGGACESPAGASLPTFSVVSASCPQAPTASVTQAVGGTWRCDGANPTQELSM